MTSTTTPAGRMVSIDGVLVELRRGLIALDVEVTARRMFGAAGLDARINLDGPGVVFADVTLEGIDLDAAVAAVGAELDVPLHIVERSTGDYPWAVVAWA